MAIVREMAWCGSWKRGGLLRANQWPVVRLALLPLLEELLHGHAGRRTRACASAGSLGRLGQKAPVPQHLGEQQEQRQQEGAHQGAGRQHALPSRWVNKMGVNNGKT